MKKTKFQKTKFEFVFFLEKIQTVFFFQKKKSEFEGEKKTRKKLVF